MLYCSWKLVAMEMQFYLFSLKYQCFENFFKEHFSKLNFLQLSHIMFCNNVAHLAVARGCHIWIRSLATAKQGTFLKNILWESCSKFNFKQCSLKKSLKILICKRESSTFRANLVKTGGLIFVTLILFLKLHFLHQT